ncbi:hypothetical protein U9M48_023075 [Paspalum notatum var. saurae]|uniref:Uncharacterized protein n=1 Tax=Paspalum notatum var. saurae TaxID=547442 RepID=A0AAQ3TMC9_PASNO
MVVSRTAWIGVGLGARLLMVAVLVAAVVRTRANHTRQSYDGDLMQQLQSYTIDGDCVTAACIYRMCGFQRHMMVATAATGVVGSVLQVPVAVYLLRKSRRRLMSPASALILDISSWTDAVVTALLMYGFALRYAAIPSYEGSDIDESLRQDLVDYYNRAKLPEALLLVGMLLSMAVSVISARLCDQARQATNDVVADDRPLSLARPMPMPRDQ